MIRSISVLLRILQQRKTDARLLKQFNIYQQQVKQLPLPLDQKSKKILIIRLDDIGDYILFRNTLTAVKTSNRWKDFEITLLGNLIWKEIFISLDTNTVDNSIWITKKEYYNKATYRKNLWQQLRDEGFEAVICPSRTRPLLLDDACALATGATIKIAAENTFSNIKVNDASDAIYMELFPKNEFLHEFFFNLTFANWCWQSSLALAKPEINKFNSASDLPKPYILCCIGAAFKSKRWPVERWIKFIELCKDEKFSVILSGSESEKMFAQQFNKQTAAINITGNTSLLEFIDHAHDALAIICNDSMAAHIGVSCNTPVVIIANGNKFRRFTAYEEAGVKKVKAIYPSRFLSALKKRKKDLPQNHIPVTKDIATIDEKEVFAALKELI